jgi:acetamidase/formamidase
LIVRDDLGFTYPRAETAEYYITMGMDPDLDQCAVMALRDMIRLICERTNLSRDRGRTPTRCAASPPTCASPRP